MALAQAQLGEWNKAQESLLSALNLKPKFRHVDLALEAILVRAHSYPVYNING